MDNLIKCPVAYEHHDVWLDSSKFDVVYVATKPEDNTSFLSVDKDGWFFIPAWSQYEDAEKYLQAKDLVGLHNITRLSLVELCLLARAIMLNNVPMLICGTNTAENVLSTYAPTPTMFSSITSIWHYAELDGEKIRTQNGDLYVQLSTSNLMARLYSEKPDLIEAIVHDQVVIRSMMFKQLVSEEEYVYSDGESLNVKNGLSVSKVLREIEGEKDV